MFGVFGGATHFYSTKLHAKQFFEIAFTVCLPSGTHSGIAQGGFESTVKTFLMWTKKVSFVNYNYFLKITEFYHQCKF